MEKINLRELAPAAPWTPLGIGFIGDTVLRLVRIEGKYDWHRHEDKEEFFLVVSGVVVIETEEERLELCEWEGCKVPVGILHRSQSALGASALIIEPVRH
ncbi:MAG: hypothetical protein ABIK09_20695 [Pseudomonadota bacterium]